MRTALLFIILMSAPLLAEEEGDVISEILELTAQAEALDAETQAVEAFELLSAIDDLVAAFDERREAPRLPRLAERSYLLRFTVGEGEQAHTSAVRSAGGEIATGFQSEDANGEHAVVIHGELIIDENGSAALRYELEMHHEGANGQQHSHTAGTTRIAAGTSEILAELPNVSLRLAVE